MIMSHSNTSSSRPAEVRDSLCARLRRALAIFVAVAFVLTPATPVVFPVPAQAAARKPAPPSPKPAGNDCDLKSARGEIQHVIYIQFDNVHFTRDNPNVPSDLEQMPNLLDFLTENGVLLSNHHTPLKSHTADDIITSLTGVYGDRHGQPVANSFGFFNPPGSKPFDGFRSSFEYWTDPVGGSDPTLFMITADGKNAPAPWVPWTRAGCNVGAVSIANMELENVSGDIKTVFANDPAVLSAALAEAKSNFNMAVADFEGIAIHCAAGNALCSSTNHGEPDVLPQEPGGYNGFNALYGHKFVAPVISPGGPLKDLDGNTVTDASSPPNVGFPGFGGISAAQTLAYVAAMQEHGVPITYAYISDAHDNHSGDNLYGPTVCATDPEFGALGPGDVCYTAQLKAYDEAFGKFFARLAADGINKSNTLFVVTADEGDHFAGGPPTPADCDGVNIPCTYAKLGEIDSNIVDLLAKEDPSTASTPIDIQFDMVPVFYIDGNPGVGSALARQFERDAANLVAVSPITNEPEQLTTALADPVELKLLHMVTGDPQRTPTFIMFGNGNWFFETFGPDANESAAFAWNHGGIQKEIVTTWLGLAGPGIRNMGIDDDIWSDHTDIRPTMLALAGLQDDYQHEGRVLVEEFHHWAVPDGIEDSGDEFVELARAFKQINAPNADLGRTSLRISTAALASGSPMDDSKYILLENQLSAITTLRDALASKMLQKLEDAAFHGKRISGDEERELTREARDLLFLVHAIEASL
jgi:arylsulfatase A-like enzyme